MYPTPSQESTEREPTDEEDAGPTGHIDPEAAVPTEVVALIVMVGSVIAVAAVGLFMHYRTWRSLRRPKGARGLDRRSDSFRYTQSY